MAEAIIEAIQNGDSSETAEIFDAERGWSKCLISFIGSRAEGSMDEEISFPTGRIDGQSR